MQRWLRVHQYAKEYLKWVYKQYASHGIAYLCTYYNLDLVNSVYDGNILDGAYYRRTGNLSPKSGIQGSASGLKWRKIIFLPVYNIETITPTFSADEEGFTKKDQVSAFNFPTEYKIQPMPHDFVRFEQDPIDPKNNNFPLYQVVNFEKATNTDVSFWKVSLKIDYKKESDYENHISQTCVFFDYTKHIYEINKGTFLYKLLERNRNLEEIRSYFVGNTSLYFLNKVT